MPNQIVKNGQKAKFPQIAPNEKQLIKFSCTYQPLSFCKNFKKFQSYKDVPFSGPKWPICPEQNFFGTYWPFSLCKIFKNSYSGSRVTGCTIFGPKMVHLPQFWGGGEGGGVGELLSFSSTNQPLSLCRILKKSSSGSRVMRMCNFQAQNGPFAQMRTFSKNLLMSLISYIHAYLHVKNQSQMLIY